MSGNKEESLHVREVAHVETAATSSSTPEALTDSKNALDYEITAYENRKMDFRTILAAIVCSALVFD